MGKVGKEDKEDNPGSLAAQDILVVVSVAQDSLAAVEGTLGGVEGTLVGAAEGIREAAAVCIWAVAAVEGTLAAAEGTWAAEEAVVAAWEVPCPCTPRIDTRPDPQSHHRSSCRRPQYHSLYMRLVASLKGKVP